MEDSKKTNSYFIKLADGGTLQVKCPVCGASEFSSARPPSPNPKAGFQHVAPGREFIDGKPGNILVLPIKFRYCLNCGFILNFVLEQGQRGDET
jgi:hypothetical protein